MPFTYNSRNSLEFYTIGELYLFPACVHNAGIQLSREEENAYASFISLLRANDTTVNTVPKDMVVRINGVVVDKERDGNNARITAIMRHDAGYEYRMYEVEYSGVVSDDDNSIPIVGSVQNSNFYVTPNIGRLRKVPSSVKAEKHTGLVEKVQKAEKHTGLVEKTQEVEKHTGLVEL